jgi:hypothetical protein
METPLSPQLSISLAIAVLATVGLIAYVLAQGTPSFSNIMCFCRVGGAAVKAAEPALWEDHVIAE